MVVVGKEFKGLYAFLSKTYGIMNKGSSNAFIYFSKNNELMFQDFDVAGQIRMKKSGTDVLQESLKNNSFYELQKLPRDRFRLKEIEEKDVTEDMIKEKDKLIERFHGEFVCEIESDEFRIMSKITRVAERYVRDSAISIIKKFGACDVYQNGMHLIFQKHEFIKDTPFETDEKMCIAAETYRQVDEYVQGKMKFEEEQRFGGEA